MAFASHFVYPSPATSAAAQATKNLLLAVKRDAYRPGNPPTSVIEWAAERVLAHHDSERCGYRSFFGPDVVLVPAPGAGKSLPRSLSVPRRICQVLKDAGLGASVFPCIERTEAVQKSAFARPGERPDHQRHYDTMRVTRGFNDLASILVVDDIVTRGATLIAAAARLQEVYPSATIRGFALARTVQVFQSAEEPCVGEISVRWGKLKREP